MLKKLENVFLYAGLDRSQFEKVAPLIAAENYTSLTFACIVQLLYFGVSFFGSFGIAEMADKKLVYGFGTLLPAILLVLHLL